MKFAGKLDSVEIKSRAESFSMEIPGNLSNRLTFIGRGKGVLKSILWHDPKKSDDLFLERKSE